MLLCFHVFLPERKTALSQKRSKVMRCICIKSIFITIKEQEKDVKLISSTSKASLKWIGKAFSH